MGGGRVVSGAGSGDVGGRSGSGGAGRGGAVGTGGYGISGGCWGRANRHRLTWLACSFMTNEVRVSKSVAATSSILGEGARGGVEVRVVVREDGVLIGG